VTAPDGYVLIPEGAWVIFFNVVVLACVVQLGTFLYDLFSDE
jgi:hypothetical protein